MSTRSILHQAMLHEWTARFADQKESGHSVTDWCQQHNFSRYQFFYWKRQLKDEVVSQSLPDIVPLTMPSTPVGSSPQVALESCASSTTFQPNPCAKIYMNGISIEIDSSATEAFIRSLIKAVRHA